MTSMVRERFACRELLGLALGLQERAKSMELPDDPTQDLTMNRALSMAFQHFGGRIELRSVRGVGHAVVLCGAVLTWVHL